MFPFRHSSIFRSRWIALFWAAGIIWMAVDIAGRPSGQGNDAQATDITGAPIDAEQMRQTEKILEQIGK